MFEKFVYWYVGLFVKVMLGDWNVNFLSILYNSFMELERLCLQLFMVEEFYDRMRFDKIFFNVICLWLFIRNV